MYFCLKNKKPIMIKLMSAALMLSATMAFCAGRGGKSPAKEKWIQLFDGKTTKGWHTYNADTIGTAWKVQDGVLWFDASMKGSGPNTGGDIVTNDVFDQFHLKLEWKISKNGNSGIMFFVQEDKAIKHPYDTGPEMQVLDNDGHPDGKITKHRSGDLYDLIRSSSEPVKPVGEWNLAEVIYSNNKLELKLNGVTVVTTSVGDKAWTDLIAGSKFKNMPAFGANTKGRIALQDHGNDVWYRNIMIRKL
jgi:hypothetical protein